MHVPSLKSGTMFLIQAGLLLAITTAINCHGHYGGGAGAGYSQGDGYSATIVGPNEPGAKLQGPGSQTNIIGPDGAHISANEIGGTIISPPKQGGIIQHSVSPGYVSGGSAGGGGYGVGLPGGYSGAGSGLSGVFPPISVHGGSGNYGAGAGGSGCGGGCGGDSGQVYPGGRGSGIEGQVVPGGRGSGVQGQVYPGGRGSGNEGQWQPDYREKQFNDGLYRGEGSYQGGYPSGGLGGAYAGAGDYATAGGYGGGGQGGFCKPCGRK